MKYISLLRGINVGGHRKIRMADLKVLYEGLGYRDVVTYIQSGNVVFTATAQDTSKIAAALAKEIEQQLGEWVPVMVRTQPEWATLIAKCPFGKIALPEDGAKYFVSFLSGVPAKELAVKIKELVPAPDELLVSGREAYLHCPGGAAKTKLTQTFLERKLSVTVTTRNWRTVIKLHDLASASPATES